MRETILWDVFKHPLRKMHSYCVSQCPNRSDVAHSPSDDLSRVYLWVHCLQRWGPGKPSERAEQPNYVPLSFLSWDPGTQRYWVGHLIEGRREHRQRGPEPQGNKVGARLMKTLTSSDLSLCPSLSGSLTSQEPLIVEPGLWTSQWTSRDRKRGWWEVRGLPGSAVNHILNKIKKTNIVSSQLKRFL